MSGASHPTITPADVVWRLNSKAALWADRVESETRYSRDTFRKFLRTLRKFSRRRPDAEKFWTPLASEPARPDPRRMRFFEIIQGVTSRAEPPGGSTNFHELFDWSAEPTQFVLNALPVKFRQDGLALAVKNIGVHGVAGVIDSWAARWESRHAITPKNRTATEDRAKSLSVPEKFYQLFRLALGFFGARKVDARNNP